MIFGWANIEMVADILETITSAEKIKNITLVVAILLIIWTLKCIFFNSEAKETMQSKEGILLENDNGKLLVSKDTIESLTNAVVKSFESAESVMTKVEVDNESHVKIYITLFVYPDAVIKDLTVSLQNDIKQTMNSVEQRIYNLEVNVKDLEGSQNILEQSLAYINRYLVEKN